jgi:hypothetical protein
MAQPGETGDEKPSDENTEADRGSRQAPTAEMAGVPLAKIRSANLETVQTGRRSHHRVLMRVISRGCSDPRNKRSNNSDVRTY